jgi:hypothetical protein
MAFTDREVGQLKGEIAKLDPFMSELFCELLERLESAEVIAEDHGSIYPNDPAVCRWREAAGK